MSALSYTFIDDKLNGSQVMKDSSFSYWAVTIISILKQQHAMIRLNSTELGCMIETSDGKTAFQIGSKVSGGEDTGEWE